MNSSLKWS